MATRDFELEESHHFNLETARLLDARKSILGLAERLAQKLNHEIEKGNDTGAFTIALILAIAKDALDGFLDFMLIGLIPVIGALPGIFISLTLTFFLLRKGWFLKTQAKVVWWVVTLVFDNIPFVNAAPLSTIQVLLAWRNVKKKAHNAKVTLANLDNLSSSELEEIDTDINTLDNYLSQ